MLTPQLVTKSLLTSGLFPSSPPPYALTSLSSLVSSRKFKSVSCMLFSYVFICISFSVFSPLGESVSVIKHTESVPDPRAVNQDKKNMLFSVRASLASVSRLHQDLFHYHDLIPDLSLLLLLLAVGHQHRCWQGHRCSYCHRSVH